MAEKKKPANKALKTKVENKAEKKTEKKETTKKFTGYVVIDGKDYKVSEGKAKELVKRGVAKYK